MDFATQHAIDENLQIIAGLLKRNPELHMPTLIQGNAGIALFFAYLYQYQQQEDHLEACVAHIEQSIEAVNTTDQTPFLATGFTGLSWLIVHLIRQGILDSDADGIIDEIRPMIIKSLDVSLMKDSYDLLYGFTGVSLFFVEDNTLDYSHIQLEIIDKLAKLAIHTEDGIGWSDSVDGTNNSFNVGLAHGIPGIIIILLQLYVQGHSTQHCEKMIRQAIQFVLSLERPTEYSSFPTMVEGSLYADTSRLAWCYGDLGVSLMLLLVGKHLQDPIIHTKGLEVAKRAATRNINSSSVQLVEDADYFDTGFCHGTGGIAYMFLRLHHLTQDETVRQAAFYWLNITLENLQPHLQKLSANFSIKEFDKNDPDIEQQYGLLEGIAGVGLVLLAFANPKKTDWSSVLLLNIK